MNRKNRLSDFWSSLKGIFLWMFFRFLHVYVRSNWREQVPLFHITRHRMNTILVLWMVRSWLIFSKMVNNLISTHLSNHRKRDSFIFKRKVRLSRVWLGQRSGWELLYCLMHWISRSTNALRVIPTNSVKGASVSASTKYPLISNSGKALKCI